ncbi:GNAT family N-acetyltransferase [Burkholderia glumae]|uniref:GNAT family N-acetyltransferase n=1 Tax=Burkholderia glumae TaxID=337 RepID=UPI00129642DA|nr:GNAT family N-acetyltransferase [Burkholderia glumae]MCM2548130.1 GNAT family N-acetyltransferase [Burkholderia glumae]NVE21232.1 GNAT family N-acetyltransferase [Burkholderia glumae]QGA37393.1 GNAT family N-acetyltransferase [Burkholderia glumae]
MDCASPPPAALPGTGRLSLRHAARRDAPALLAYYLANRAHLEPWAPSRPESFYTLPSIETRLDAMATQAAAGQAVHLLLYEKAGDRLIGECSLTNIVRGPFQACHLGFSIASDREGRGLMRECLIEVIRYAFGPLGLHRLMANHRPENTRSARLLEALGFEREGIARAYLKIDGAWADHVLRSLINPADA